MGNITTKLNLAGFKNAAITMSGKEGNVKCLLIPIEQNKFFVSEKGAVYVDLVGFESNGKVEGSRDTHLVKQSFTKEYLATLTEDEKKSLPILGNHVDWDKAEPTQHKEKGAVTASKADDLPF